MLSGFRHSYFGRLFFYYITAGVLLVLLTVFMILGLAGASVENGIREQTQSGVRAIADSLDSFLGNLGEIVSNVAGDGVVAGYLGGSGGVTRYDVARVLYLSGVNSANAFDLHVIRLSDGEITSTGSASEVFSRENYNENYTLFRRILSSDGVVVYKTVRGINMLGDTRMILAKAARDGAGRPLGLVVAEISRAAFESVVSGHPLVGSRPVLVVDLYDVVLYSSTGPEAEGLGKLGARGLGGVWASDAPSGGVENSSLYWTKLSFTDCAVLGEASPTLLNSVVSSASRAILPVLLAACAIGMLFAFIVAKSVSAPIKRLTLAMRRVEKGNFSAAVPVTSRDEIGQLSEAFNHMQSQIEELIANIEEKQRSLRIAEINALSLQVNPHFLYNTLDLIKWSDKLGKPGETSRIVVQLGKLLRRLMNNKADVVPLSEELELVQAYLEIQRSRYLGKLDIRFDIEEGLEKARIPKLVLQPLIENAIVHGLEGKPGGGRLLVTGRRAGDLMRFVVLDDGEGMTPERLKAVRQLRPNGMYNIALGNVHQRARLYGDDRCGLTIESELGRGTVITLVLKAIEPAGEE